MSELNVYGLSPGTVRAEVFRRLGAPEGDGFIDADIEIPDAWRPPLDTASVWTYRKGPVVTAFFQSDKLVEIWGDQLSRGSQPLVAAGAGLEQLLPSLGVSLADHPFSKRNGRIDLPLLGLVIRCYRRDLAGLRAPSRPASRDPGWRPSGTIRDEIQRDLAHAIMAAPSKGLASPRDGCNPGQVEVRSTTALEADLECHPGLEPVVLSKLFRSCFARVVGLRPRSVLLEFTPSGLEAALRYCLENSTRYGLESPRTGRILACRDEPRARLIAVALARMCQGEVCRLEDFSDWRACLQHLAQLGQLRVRQPLLEWLSGWSHHSGHEEWFTLLVEGSPTPAMLHAACELRAIRDDLPIHQVGRDEDCDIIFPLGQSLGQKRYSIPTGEEPANFDLDDVASRFWLLQKPRRLALSRGLSREEGTFPRVEAALRGLRALPEHPVPQGLELPAEGWALARRVEHFPWLVAGIGDSPHRLASYVSTVAREALDYLDRNESFDPAELALLQGVRIVIERGLEMLGLA